MMHYENSLSKNCDDAKRPVGRAYRCASVAPGQGFTCKDFHMCVYLSIFKQFMRNDFRAVKLCMFQVSYTNIHAVVRDTIKFVCYFTKNWNECTIDYDYELTHSSVRPPLPFLFSNNCDCSNFWNQYIFLNFWK